MKYFPGNIKMYLQFILSPHADMTLVVEIIPHVRPEHNYSTSMAMEGDRALTTILFTIFGPPHIKG